MKDEFTTGELYDIVSRTESISEYKELFEGLENQKSRWMGIMNQIMEENHLSLSQMGELCEVSRQTVQKWLKGALPKNRETYIKIGFAAKYDLEEMNFFLQRYGCCNKLYPKSLEDSVYIFVLSSDCVEHTYASCKAISEMLRKEIQSSGETESTEGYETSAISMELLRMKSLPQMLEFVQKKAPVYKEQFYRFYEYVESFIEKNLFEEEDSVHLLAESQQWSSSLKQSVSEISRKKWYPQRDKIISLGIHLNMDVDQVNQMLDLAQMEGLCAKVPFENAIIYALENAKLEDIIYCDGSDELCLYVRTVLESLDNEEVDFFIKELPNEEENTGV